jgi:hypothetical protein
VFTDAIIGKIEIIAEFDCYPERPKMKWGLWRQHADGDGRSTFGGGKTRPPWKIRRCRAPSTASARKTEQWDILN